MEIYTLVVRNQKPESALETKCFTVPRLNMGQINRGGTAVLKVHFWWKNNKDQNIVANMSYYTWTYAVLAPWPMY